MASRPRKWTPTSQTEDGQSAADSQFLERRRRNYRNVHKFMDKLREHAASFIKVFDNYERRMRQIVGEFQKVAEEVKEMKMQGIVGVVTGGVACACGVLAAPFTGWGTLSIAGAGGAVVGASIQKKKQGEKESVKKVDERRREFMVIVERLENDVEEINRMCEMLEQLQAKNTLSDLKELQRILSLVPGLGSTSKKVLSEVQNMMKVIRFSEIPENNQKLRDFIIHSADHCKKIIDKFDQMKGGLKVFTKNWRYKPQ